MAEERELVGDEIRARLAGNTVFSRQEGADWRQYFAAKGRTTYIEDGAVSEGYWRVEGDSYCSLWRLGGRWDCYRVTGGEDERGRPTITWISGNTRYRGVIVPGNQLEAEAPD